MVRYLASLPPGIRIGVFVLGERLGIVQGFTEDSTLLRASIDSLAGKASTSPLESKPDELATESSAMSQMDSMGTGPGGAQVAALQSFLRRQLISEKNNQFLITMESLQTIARYLSGIPGRKNLIWFVGSFPLCPPPMCPYDDVYRETMDVLAKARVSVYPVDARGVLAPNSDMGTAGDQSSSLLPGAWVPLPNGKGAASSSKEPYFAFINTETVAEKTGGKAFHGNDFKGELAEAIADGSRYYTLAYTPHDRKEIGRERKIEVTLASGRYELFYRRSYFEETRKEIRAAEAAPAKDPLRPLMDRGMPNFTELRYRMTVVPATPQPAPDAARAGDNADLKPPFTRYRVNFSLSTDGVKLVQGPDGVRRGSIEVALIAYSQAGKPLNWEFRIFNLAIHPEQNAIAQSSGIPFYFDIDAPPGDVYLRTGIYANSSSRAGTLEIPLSSITVASK
jgi:VWFA-related protein